MCDAWQSMAFFHNINPDHMVRHPKIPSSSDIWEVFGLRSTLNQSGFADSCHWFCTMLGAIALASMPCCSLLLSFEVPLHHLSVLVPSLLMLCFLIWFQVQCIESCATPETPPKYPPIKVSGSRVPFMLLLLTCVMQFTALCAWAVES